MLKIEDIWEGMSHGQVMMYNTLFQTAVIEYFCSAYFLYSDYTPHGFHWEFGRGLESSHLVHDEMLNLESLLFPPPLLSLSCITGLSS